MWREEFDQRFTPGLSGVALFCSLCRVTWSAVNKHQHGALQRGSGLSLLDHMCRFLHLLLCLPLQPSFCRCLILQVARYVTVTALSCHRMQVGVFPLLRGGWHLVSKDISAGRNGFTLVLTRNRFNLISKSAEIILGCLENKCGSLGKIAQA